MYNGTRVIELIIIIIGPACNMVYYRTVWKWLIQDTDLGWGLLSQFPPFHYFVNFSALSEHTLAVKYHGYIWQVSPQLSCGGTCQIYTWIKESKRYFCQIENFACREINEQSFSNPHPWLRWAMGPFVDILPINDCIIKEVWLYWWLSARLW